jgi:hypothetical protein
LELQQKNQAAILPPNMISIAKSTANCQLFFTQKHKFLPAAQFGHLSFMEHPILHFSLPGVTI